MVSPIVQDNISDFKKAERDLKSGVVKTANEAGRNVREMFNTASDEIVHASDVAVTEIRANPVRSTMIALGVGALLGMLLRR